MRRNSSSFSCFAPSPLSRTCPYTCNRLSSRESHLCSQTKCWTAPVPPFQLPPALTAMARVALLLAAALLAMLGAAAGARRLADAPAQEVRALFFLGSIWGLRPSLRLVQGQGAWELDAMPCATEATDSPAGVRRLRTGRCTDPRPCLFCSRAPPSKRH